MALELQISTQQAQANIEAANAAIRDFVTVTQQLSRGVENVEKFTAALNGLRPVSGEVIASINGLAQATNSLSAGAANIERFASAMSTINSGGGAATAASAISNVSRAAAGVDGSKLDALAAGMSRAGQAAAGTVSPMAAAMASANNYRSSLDNVAAGMSNAGQASVTTGAHLDAVSRGMTAAGQSAAAGAGNFNNLAGAANNAGGAAGNCGRQFSVFRGIMESLVFATVIGGFKSLVEGATEASTEITKLKIQIDTITGVAGSGAQAWNHLKDTALALSTPIEALTSTFGRFANAFIAGGHSLTEAERVYDNFAVTFRALGLGAGEVTRSFIAVDQVFQKGKVQSEELVRQLGQNIPAMALLAKSMGLVTSEGEPAVAQLQAMMKAGQVSSDVFIKFSEDLRTKYAPAVAEMTKTGGAALTAFSNGLFQFKAAMGDGIFAGITAELNSFGAALSQTGGPLQVLGNALGFVVGGVGAAFLYVIQSWMTYLGTAAQLIGGAASAVAQFGEYLASVVPAGSAFASVLSGIGSVASFVMSVLGPLATVVITGAMAVGVFSYALNTLRSVLAPVGTLIYAALTNPFVQMTIVGAAIVASIVGIGTAIYSLYQTLANGSSFTENFSNNITAIGTVVQEAGAKLFELIPKAQQSAGALGGIGDNTSTATAALGGFTGTVAGLNTPMEDLKNQSGQAATNLNQAASAAGNANSSLGAASGSAAQLASNFNTSAGAADNAASAYARAAAAAERYARAIAATGGGGGGGTGGAKMYYGGTALKGGAGQKFTNARTYAGGGVTPDVSGGIPSILHANEAVVPLRAGGTIPISLVGTSAPSGNEASPVVSLLQQIAQDDVTRDALLGQHNDKLDLILGQLTSAFPKATEFYQNALNTLNSVLGALNTISVNSASGGSRGGSSSGGYTGGTGTGTIGDGTLDVNAAARALQTQIAQNELGKNNKFFDAMQEIKTAAGRASAIGAGGIYNPQYLWQQYYKSDTAAQNAQIDLKNQELINQFDAQYGKGAYAKAINPRGFATGSPNASKDTTGGFTATLHPNEAVIPLPDGRTVPVSLSADVESNLTALKAMLGTSQRMLTATVSNSGSQQQTTNNNNKVTMIIQTPDANSFRKSQPQIMADLRGQLQRAQQTSGAVKRSTEDPTKRLVWRA